MSIESIRGDFNRALESAKTLQEIETVRVAFLGKSSDVNQLMKSLGTLPTEERKTQGETIQALRLGMEAALQEKLAAVKKHAFAQQIAEDAIDITLPVQKRSQGKAHPLIQGMKELIDILQSMGFHLADGPEIEDDYHNFTALNVPESHPARQMQDTFYLNALDQNDAPMVLRTQTSSVQIRVMKQFKPPYKIIVPGRVFRSDSDATHTPNFHQIEGLYIDKGIHMGHLKACLLELCQRFFEKPDLKIRFRPSFFPFTEPSAEMDICCTRGADTMIVGEGSDWLEVLGCGMVHPKVLEGCGIDPQEYQGFAWGMGVDRFTMLKYGITDLRALFEGDMRWVQHFGFPLSKAYEGA